MWTVCKTKTFGSRKFRLHLPPGIKQLSLVCSLHSALIAAHPSCARRLLTLWSGCLAEWKSWDTSLFCRKALKCVEAAWECTVEEWALVCDKTHFVLCCIEKSLSHVCKWKILLSYLISETVCLQSKSVRSRINIFSHWRDSFRKRGLKFLENQWGSYKCQVIIWPHVSTVVGV